MCNERPLTVELAYEDGSKRQYSFPQEIDNTIGILGGEWISLPNNLTNEETKWVFYELCTKISHVTGDY